jgi:hypothetical protein
MSDIFLSYSSADRPKVKKLANALERQGFSVWWDPTIPNGKKYREVIGEELASARCVIVVWSKTSLESDWVDDEAEEGKGRGILIPVKIENVKPPMGYRNIQTADLTNLEDFESSSNFQKLLEDLKDKLSINDSDWSSNDEVKHEEKTNEKIEKSLNDLEIKKKPDKKPKSFVANKVGKTLKALFIVFILLLIIGILVDDEKNGTKPKVETKIVGKWDEKKAEEIVLSILNKENAKAIKEVYGFFHLTFNASVNNIIGIASSSESTVVCVGCETKLSLFEFKRVEKGWEIGAKSINEYKAVHQKIDKVSFKITKASMYEVYVETISPELGVRTTQTFEKVGNGFKERP